MGYMGFGMSRWTYIQRARKAFSKGRSKPLGNTLPLYKRKFRLQPSLKSNSLHILICSVLLGVLLFSVCYKSRNLIIHIQDIETTKNKRRKQIDDEAFQFLLQSGISRLKSNDLVGAYSELKLAHNIYPNHVKLNALLTNTLIAYCKNENQYCRELDVRLDNSNEP